MADKRFNLGSLGLRLKSNGDVVIRVGGGVVKLSAKQWADAVEALSNPPAPQLEIVPAAEEAKPEPAAPLAAENQPPA